MMISSVCFSRTYYRSEKIQNAEIGNFVYVDEYCSAQVWPQMFEKMGKAQLKILFEKMVEF